MTEGEKSNKRRFERFSLVRSLSHQSVSTPCADLNRVKSRLRRSLSWDFFFCPKDRLLARTSLECSVGNWKMVFWLPGRIGGEREVEEMVFSLFLHSLAMGGLERGLRERGTNINSVFMTWLCRPQAQTLSPSSFFVPAMIVDGQLAHEEMKHMFA